MNFGKQPRLLEELRGAEVFGLGWAGWVGGWLGIMMCTAQMPNSVEGMHSRACAGAVPASWRDLYLTVDPGAITKLEP